MLRSVVIAASLLLAACSTTGGLFNRGSSGETTSAGETEPASGRSGVAFDVEGLAVYLEMMRVLIEGDSLTQAETFRSVAEAADYAPTTTNRLKLALALAVPGHPGSDAAEAERRLSALLSAGNALLPEEQILATIQLRDVEQRLVLDAAAQRLRREMETALAEQNSTSAVRVQGLLEENERLRTALDDATAKLDAITNIEQSIRERESGAN